MRAFGCVGELDRIWGFPFGRVQRGFAAFPTPRTVSASVYTRSLMAAFGRHGEGERIFRKFTLGGLFLQNSYEEVTNFFTWVFFTVVYQLFFFTLSEL